MSLHGFNLLIDNISPPDAWDKVNEWVTNVGRIIVMLVEVVVIGSFMARVVIDTQTKNLLEKERANAAAVAAFRQKEVAFRDKQQQFETYKQMWDQSSSYAELMKELQAAKPKQMDEVNISIQGDLVNYKGKSPIVQVGQLESKLKSSDTFSDVQVYEVERVTVGSGSTNLEEATFGIRLLVKPEIIVARDKFNPETASTN